MRDRARRSLVTLASVVVVLAGARAARPIMVPILLALFISFVSAPVMFRLSRSRFVPHPVAVAVVLSALLGLIFGAGMVLSSPLGEIQSRLPFYKERLIGLTTDGAGWLTAHGIEVQSSQLTSLGGPSAAINLARLVMTSATALLSNGVLVAFIVAFTLIDARRIWTKVEQHFAGGQLGDHVMATVSDEVGRYLGIKTLTSGATGLLTGLWCWAWGIDFAIVWGFLAFVLNYIPTLGSILASLPPIALALFMGGPVPAVAIGAGYLSVNLLVGSVVEPRIMGDALGLSPVVVLLSMVLWGWVLGPIGALLSVPITMVLKVALSTNEDLAWLADLMSAERRFFGRKMKSDQGSLEDPDAPEVAEGQAKRG